MTIGNTTAGIVPDDTTAGAPLVNAFTGANTGYLAVFGALGSVAGAVRLYDRLYHAGSFSALSLATSNITAPPSYAARVPGASYVGVEMWIEINAAVSATATTVTVSYTNQAGTAARTATLDTNLSGAPANRMLPFRLQAGDTGVQSIQSVTVGGVVATTGTFNIVILRELATAKIIAAAISEPMQDAFKVGLPQLFATSCLCLMFLATTTSTGTVFADLEVING